ncbi:hypothetical protein C7387_1473 [Yokenella regensburgei]|jgi:hypothetical protein|uniref:Uncharacterized protein n=1 Tax=Yokenella regensburgei TaxID=158877 RepID=A0ABX9S1S6_9ENTR|nr:hypothetical protein C7387_1473 [Yokenella regensburgei]
MVVSGQSVVVKPVCQSDEQCEPSEKVVATSVPESWKLTPQQKAFIEAFIEETPAQKK